MTYNRSSFDIPNCDPWFNRSSTGTVFPARSASAFRIFTWRSDSAVQHPTASPMACRTSPGSLLTPEYTTFSIGTERFSQISSSPGLHTSRRSAASAAAGIRNGCHGPRGSSSEMLQHQIHKSVSHISAGFRSAYDLPSSLSDFFCFQICPIRSLFCVVCPLHLYHFPL